MTVVWPAKFAQFAINSREAWEESVHVLEVTSQDFDDPQFNSTARILAFTNDREIQDVQEAILSALPNIARRMTDANISVGVVSCASELNDDPTLVDCSTLDVNWLPDVKLFAANQTSGLSLLGEEFGDRRDAQIAMESMAQTLTAFFGLQEGSIMDDKSDEQGLPDDGQSGGSCGSNGMQFDNFDDVDDSLQKLDAPDEMDKIAPPEEEMEQVQDADNIPQELNDERSNKPKLASTSPEKPKLADRPNNARNLPQFAKRQKTNHGGGSVFGGISSGGGARAIAGR